MLPKLEEALNLTYHGARAQDQNAVVVRATTAAKNDLVTISDLVPFAPAMNCVPAPGVPFSEMGKRVNSPVEPLGYNPCTPRSINSLRSASGGMGWLAAPARRRTA